jgi:hypothetical protein
VGLEALLGRIEDEYSKRADTRTAKDLREEREAYWNRIGERADRFTPAQPVTRRRKRTVVEGPSDQDVWEDDLEEWEAVMAKKRAARKRKQEEDL